jgi:RsmE family RNA methyltransferase
MNLLLLTPEQCLTPNADVNAGGTKRQWRIHGQRFVHIRDVLKLSLGDALRAGELNGQVGLATIVALATDHAVVTFRAEQPPIPALPLQLILALPRPKMLKRTLLDASSLGVKKIVLINSWKVDKSYWQTPNLKSDLLHEKLLLGLEQAQDTRLPEIILAPRFKPFMEDQLDLFAGKFQRIIAHPGTSSAMPSGLTEPVTLAIGPEGGWTEYELSLFLEHRFATHHFGQRILRVETALPALIGRLMQLP